MARIEVAIKLIEQLTKEIEKMDAKIQEQAKRLKLIALFSELQKTKLKNFYTYQEFFCCGSLHYEYQHF